MSILNRGNSQDKTALPRPPMPKPQQPAPQPQQAKPDPRVIPPEVEEHITKWRALIDENERLRAQVQDLTNHLIVARERQQDLEGALHNERTRLAATDRTRDTYGRYAQEIFTRLDDARQQLDKAHERAMQVATECGTITTTPPADADELVRGMAKIVDQTRAQANGQEHDEQRNASERPDRTHESAHRQSDERMGERAGQAPSHD